MEQRTHLLTSKEIVGKAEIIQTDEEATAVLKTNGLMGVDEQGLVHGGFTFGLADYAAMVAVNDPFVVLLSSQVQFLRPVKVGDELKARAVVAEKEGRKRKVRVEIWKEGEEKVFAGEFSCLVLQKHVLEK